MGDFRLKLLLQVVAAAWCMIGVCAAADWPPVSAAEWELEQLQWYPNAPAVILRQEGTLNPTRLGANTSSNLSVFTRIKILTDEGTGYGTVSLLSSEVWRLRDLEARTLLPDGRVIELADEATFSKTFSAYYTRSAVSFVMPGVVPGAIIEYRYRSYFDSLYFSEPWFFESQLPVLVSRFVCDVPREYYFETHVVSPLGLKVEKESEDHVVGTRVSFTAERVAPIPEEPSRAPFADLATRVYFLPKSRRTRRYTAILESWRNVIHHIRGNPRDGYGYVRSDVGSANRQARKIAADLHTEGEKAAAVYRWVRDVIVTRPPPGISPGELGADVVLKRREGSQAQKAILLQVMLEAVGVDASIAMTGNRFRGLVDPEMINPAQFDSVVVVADVGGSRVFLDASRPGGAFATLPPSLEGVPCLLLDARGETWARSPETPPEGSRREARLQLEVDGGGVVSGKGALVLTGHHGRRALRPRSKRDDAEIVWQAILERQLPGWIVTGVEVVEVPEESRVEVGWQQRRREEDVLGDEVIVRTSEPLAITGNPFTLPAERRSTPVLLAFADRSEVEVEVRWPEGWQLDVTPRLRDFESSMGALDTTVQVDPGGRRLVARRTLTLKRREVPVERYPDLFGLYREVLSSDAESVILVQE